MPHRRNLRSTGLRRKGVRSCCDNTCFSKEHHGRKAPGMGQPSHMQTRQALQPDKRFPAQTLIWTRPNFYSDSIMGVYEQARDIVQMILPGVKSRSREVAKSRSRNFAHSLNNYSTWHRGVDQPQMPQHFPFTSHMPGQVRNHLASHVPTQPTLQHLQLHLPFGSKNKVEQ